MSRIIARPSELDLDSPGRRDYYVALEHDSTWSEQLTLPGDQRMIADSLDSWMTFWDTRIRNSRRGR